MAKRNEGKAVPPPRPEPTRRKAITDQQFLIDLTEWFATDPKVGFRLLRLVQETLREPFEGIGKPEPMKHDYSGCWSRRLTEEHRVVYRVTNEYIEFLTAKSHYGD